MAPELPGVTPDPHPQGIRGQAGTVEFFLQGIAASEGIAIGPAFLYAVQDLAVPTRPASQPNVEIARFLSAVNRRVWN
jgi:hypothetical protein